MTVRLGSEIKPGQQEQRALPREIRVEVDRVQPVIPTGRVQQAEDAFDPPFRGTVAGVKVQLAELSGRQRAASEASAAAVTRRTSRFSSTRHHRLGTRDTPPVDSMVMAGGGGAVGGTFVALRPASPLKMNCATAPRFSPVRVISRVVPR